MADLINKQDVLDEIVRFSTEEGSSVECQQLYCDINNMPAYKEPKTGHWILTDDDFVYCSECEDSYYPRPIDASWYYCPHCGAKMESEDKE